MGFFFASDSAKVPWAFKLCGCFQAICDVGLGVQWWAYGDGGDEGLKGEERRGNFRQERERERDVRLT